MHQIRVHLQFLGYPVVNDPLYNHTVFGPEKGKGGRIGKSDDQLIQDLISIHNAENWLGGGGGPLADVVVDDASPLPIVKEPPKSFDVKTASSTGAGGETSSTAKRSETPDSACDVQSNSADSPSSASNGSSNNVGTEVKPSTSSANASTATSASTIATQTGIEEADSRFDTAKLSTDPHCYECKVKYRDPRPKDLVMFLHAWKYSVRKS